MRIDVFTLVPHAFAWLTEQQPIAGVLGTELELRLVNYRETTPLRAGQVDDEPYGGGAGMVLRVDVVAAALEAIYGADRPQRVIALTPQGRPLTQAIVEELAELDQLTLLSSRFEGFDERIVEHLASDAISVGPYVLSNGDLPAMVVLDAVARRLPGALAEGSGELESFSEELGGGLEYPHYTRPAEFRGWTVPDMLGRLFPGLPRSARVALDWVLTIAGAILIVFALKMWVVNPYRIPSSSMEPTLHCAAPAPGCEAQFSDRVLANRFIYHFRNPKRGEIIVFNTPPEAKIRCGAGGTFVKRLVGLPGETVSERDGIVYINGVELKEPYIAPDRRDHEPPRTWAKIPKGYYFFMGDNRAQSCDSRVWGPVPRRNLIGEVFFVYWPPNRLGFR